MRTQKSRDDIETLRQELYRIHQQIKDARWKINP